MAKMRTLKDVLESGYNMLAICHNVRCRHVHDVDVKLMADRIGSAQSLIPVPNMHHFSEQMRCKKCGHKGMYIWVEAPVNPEPIANSALNFRIYAYDLAMKRPWYEVARMGDTEVAHAAFEIAEAIHPRRRMELTFQNRVLRSSQLKSLVGGKV